MVINGLGVSANETVEVTAYVSATVANSTKYAPVNSEQSAPFSVTTYDAPLRWRYLCGEINDWNTATAPIFWETAAGTNIYECMVDFTPNCVNNPPSDPENYSFFKVLENADWYGYDKITPTWTIVENKDSNFSAAISDNCIYQISVNWNAMSISQKAVGNKLGLIGSFNNWAGDVPFTYDALTSTWKTEPVSLSANTEIKLRIDGTWEGTLNWGDAGKASTAVPGGMELAENSSNNIVVAEGGTYVVVLHANRTPYVLELQKQ